MEFKEKSNCIKDSVYIDDGISGTTFEREGLQAMLAEVEKGNIGTIIVKDMSRLGRNYVQMGMLREQLRVGLWQNREIKNPYKWGSSTIAHILQKHEYLGHTVNFKTRKHFKDKNRHLKNGKIPYGITNHYLKHGNCNSFPKHFDQQEIKNLKQ